MLRGDGVKDDSGTIAELTEQGSFASHMTAAKGLDLISRMLDCVDETSGELSAYTT